MVRSYPQTWFITKDNVRRTNTREQRLWKTKNNVLGLVIEDGGRHCQYQLWWTKDVGTRQIKMVSVKMETCQNGQNTTAAFVISHDYIWGAEWHCYGNGKQSGVRDGRKGLCKPSKMVLCTVAFRAAYSHLWLFVQSCRSTALRYIPFFILVSWLLGSVITTTWQRALRHRRLFSNSNAVDRLVGNWVTLLRDRAARSTFDVCHCLATWYVTYTQIHVNVTSSKSSSSDTAKTRMHA